MAYIRKRSEELTGMQESAMFRPSIDLKCDFVMVYGIDDSMEARIKKFRESGYVIHLMTGIAWGNYQDYLNGLVDGREHWDEAQKNREGEDIIHNPSVPYMVPTISFLNFLIERLKKAVDYGVEAIHVEEPEFWDDGGYSEAFKREYLIYYKEAWVPPHSSLDARYKASKLKAYLYKRAIETISSALKEYALVKHGKLLRFYVPTHSIINYTQWKIISPESALIDIPSLDGYIAQIWTGTSRCPNVYQGKYQERTFETAYLEYGAMQELVKGTGRRMWFLHDPIEDNPGYTWENFAYNYQKTVVASLLHPLVHHYEICPWPHRVFDGIYPRFQPNIETKDETSFGTKDSKPIPNWYRTMLSSVVQLLGDMGQSDFSYPNFRKGFGVFVSDSGLYQRNYPDGIVKQWVQEDLLAVINKEQDNADLMDRIAESQDCQNDFAVSGSYPNFFGQVMPLLKYGLPVRPIQLDNVRRFADYLGDLSYAVLSYEHIKPEAPDLNASLASWVKGGGILLYIGDDRDPYHQVDGWWKKAGYQNPREHLFELLELEKEEAKSGAKVGKGKVYFLEQAASKACLNKREADFYRQFVKDMIEENGDQWEFSNTLSLKRGPYRIASVMDESVNETPWKVEGLFADMFTSDYQVISSKTLSKDESCVLFDFSQIEGEEYRVIGSSARIENWKQVAESLSFSLEAADQVEVFVRIRLPKEPKQIKAEGAELDWLWDNKSRTILLKYQSFNQRINLNMEF